MATDKTYPSGLRRVGSGNGEQAHSTYGHPTPDSIEAALDQVGGKADAAYETIDGLAVNVTTIPAGNAGSGSWTGTIPNKVLNLSIPAGERGPAESETLVKARSTRAALPVRKALLDGTLRVVYAGDSKVEGTGLHVVASRSLNLLASMLRERYPIPGGDAGIGFIPVRYWDAWQEMDKAPTLTGTPTQAVYQIAYQGGPGNRAVQLNQAGDLVTYKPESFRYLTVAYTQGETLGSGEVEVVVDGTLRQTINTAGAGPVERRGPRLDLGSVATRTVVLRWKSGIPRVGGVLFQTATTGITVEDHSHSGFSLQEWTQGQPGSPASDDRLLEQVALASPHLIVAAFGANDQMRSATGAEWGAGLAVLIQRLKAAAPGAGIILVHGAQRVEDVTADPHRITRFEAAARAAIGDDPQVSIVYESLMWAPRAGADYTYGGPEGWLVDSVHPAALGHRLIAEALMRVISPG